MLNSCCCSSRPCNMCVHKNLCKHIYVDQDTAKMKIDHGPYIFDDKYKNCALTGFNAPNAKSEEKEDVKDG